MNGPTPALEMKISVGVGSFGGQAEDNLGARKPERHKNRLSPLVLPSRPSPPGGALSPSVEGPPLSSRFRAAHPITPILCFSFAAYGVL